MKEGKRKVEREVRDEIQKDMDEHGDQLIMHNRISWYASDKIRKTEGLATTPKRKRQEDEDTPTAKKGMAVSLKT